MRASLGRGSIIEGGLLMVIGYLEGWRGWRGRLVNALEHRDAATLVPIIQQHIRPGSIVYSDEWSSYQSLNAATGLVHNTVNHSLHFVDPTTGAHTQGVEGMWSCCKRMLREEKTMHSQLFETYLPEFMWRKRFGGPLAFSNILKHIAEQYLV